MCRAARGGNGRRAIPNKTSGGRFVSILLWLAAGINTAQKQHELLAEFMNPAVLQQVDPEPSR